MHESLQKLNLINNKIKEIILKKQLKTHPQIIAVSKTFSLNKITPLLDAGHSHFGENKIQEAENKWFEFKSKSKNLQLHMIGKLQSNKVKKAVKLFDYIHSVDSIKVAKKINLCEKEFKKKIKLFIQVNITGENQKTGISLNNLNSFYNFCVKDLSLNVIGLMCMPPLNHNSDKYFKILKEHSKKLNLNDISIGMSHDYEQAVLYGSTYLRIGTAIFGKRNA